jgi:DNA polymerase-1
VKACIVARKGKVFVGADWAQIEPRIFASFSKDERLLKCFSDGEDFYSVVGAPVFGVADCTFKKDDSPNSFPVKYKSLRNIAKIIALAIPYGTTAPQLRSELLTKAGIKKDMRECQEIINNYLTFYSSVNKLMLDSYETIKKKGYVTNLFGRRRRIPEAMEIPKQYGRTPHHELPRAARTMLNQAMNFPIQSTAASILNRSMIEFLRKCKECGMTDVKIVLAVHDEIIVECKQEDADKVLRLLKDAMEHTVKLEGVKLIAEPKVGKNLAELK